MKDLNISSITACFIMYSVAVIRVQQKLLPKTVTFSSLITCTFTIQSYDITSMQSLTFNQRFSNELNKV